MVPRSPSPAPRDAQADLARERNHLAAERSLLSFIRSSLTLIGIGVGLEQVVSVLSSGIRYTDGWVYSFSLVLIGLGVMSLGLAGVDHQAEMKRLKAPEYVYTPRWSLGEATGIGVLVTGVVAFGWLGLSALR